MTRTQWLILVVTAVVELGKLVGGISHWHEAVTPPAVGAGLVTVGLAWLGILSRGAEPKP